MSERSLSMRSRSASVKEIIEGSVLAPPAEKSLWHMQRKRSIITRARGATQRKFDGQAKAMQEQLEFLRKEDGILSDKMDLLTLERHALEASLNRSFDFTFISKDIPPIRLQ